jgi:hypothetical protein
MPSVIDEYTTLRTLGKGTFGKVKLAARADGGTVAIKYCLHSGHPWNIACLKNETETL